MFSNEPFHKDVQVLDEALELIYNNFLRRQDLV